MIVAGHQPTFMPYLGFWSKVQACDRFVILPHYQFKYNCSEAFNHRCRVGDDHDWSYWTLPIVRNKFPICIHEVSLRQELMDERWQKFAGRHMGDPYWKEFSGEFKGALANAPRTMAELNIRLIRLIASILGLDSRIVIHDKLPSGDGPTQKIQDFCDFYGATTYVSGRCGRDYMDLDKMRTPTLFNDHRLPSGYQTVSVASCLVRNGLDWTKGALSESVNLATPNTPAS